MRRRYGMGVPKFKTPWTIRMAREEAGLRELESQSTIFKLVSAEGDPATKFRFGFHGKTLVPADSGNGVQLGDYQEVDVRTGPDFPRQAPGVQWKTPIVHPNISGGSVCFGNFAAAWTPNYTLADLAEILWDYARLAILNPSHAYNRSLPWDELRRKLDFPVDRRPLRDKVLPNNAGSSVIRPEGGEDDILVIDDDGSCR
jgi:ubiquitin-protein ligase